MEVLNEGPERLRKARLEISEIIEQRGLYRARSSSETEAAEKGRKRPDRKGPAEGGLGPKESPRATEKVGAIKDAVLSVLADFEPSEDVPGLSRNEIAEAVSDTLGRKVNPTSLACLTRLVSSDEITGTDLDRTGKGFLYAIMLKGGRGAQEDLPVVLMPSTCPPLSSRQRFPLREFYDALSLGKRREPF